MKTNIVTAFSTMLAVSAGLAAAQLTLPVTDNFPSGGPELNWVNYDLATAYTNVESFSPSAPSGDGFVMNVNDGGGHGQIFLADDDGSLTDVKITAYVYIPDNTSVWSRVGITARINDTATSPDWRPDGYYMIADTDGDDYLRLRKHSGGAIVSPDPYQSPGGATGEYTRGAWNKFELIVVGDRIVGEVDDVVKFDVTDSEFSSGYVGLYNYTSGTIAGGGSPSLFDRVTIEAATSADLPSTDVSDWTMYE